PRLGSSSCDAPENGRTGWARQPTTKHRLAQPETKRNRTVALKRGSFLVRRLVRFNLPAVTMAREHVQTPEGEGEDQADQGGREVRFPRNIALDRQHAPDERAVHETNGERRGDRAPVAADQSGNE